MVLDDHWEALEADFSRFHGRRLIAAVFGDEALAPAELYSLIVQLPDDSAFARAVSVATGRFLPQERHLAAQFNLLHQLLDVSIQAATGGKAHAQPLAVFLEVERGAPPVADRVKPRTMRDWMRALGAFTAGVPLPPDRGGER